MKDMAKQVHRTADEQSRGTRLIVETIENVRTRDRQDGELGERADRGLRARRERHLGGVQAREGHPRGDRPTRIGGRRTCARTRPRSTSWSKSCDPRAADAPSNARCIVFPCAGDRAPGYCDRPATREGERARCTRWPSPRASSPRCPSGSGPSASLRVVLEIGRLSGVVPDALRFCFEICAKDTILDGAALEIREIAGRAHCGACGADVALDASGRGVRVRLARARDRALGASSGSMKWRWRDVRHAADAQRPRTRTITDHDHDHAHDHDHDARPRARARARESDPAPRAGHPRQERPARRAQSRLARGSRRHRAEPDERAGVGQDDAARAHDPRSARRGRRCT